MSFDLNTFDTLTASESGTTMPILNPRTRAPVLKPDGTPYTITLHGRNSTPFREAMRVINERRGDMAARGIARTTEDIENDDVELLVACTKGWDLDVLDGQPFSYSRENSRKLWSDRRFMSLRDMAVKHVMDDANFLPA